MNESYEYLASDLDMFAEAAAAILHAKEECSRLGFGTTLESRSGTTQSALGEAMGRLQAMAEVLKGEGVLRGSDIHQGREAQYRAVESACIVSREGCL